VTIVQSRALPFNDVYHTNFRRRVLQESKAVGTEFVFEDYLDETVPKEGHVTTRNGVTLRADLVVRLFPFPFLSTKFTCGTRTRLPHVEAHLTRPF
jgi:hypothetical protein